MASPIDLLTTEGYDLQFGTNVLGMEVSFSSSQTSESLTKYIF